MNNLRRIEIVFSFFWTQVWSQIVLGLDDMNEIAELMKEFGIRPAHIIIIVLVLFGINSFLRKTKIYQKYRKNKKRRGWIEGVLLLVLALGVILLF